MQYRRAKAISSTGCSRAKQTEDMREREAIRKTINTKLQERKARGSEFFLMSGLKENTKNEVSSMCDDRE